ncbi:hypothetical protein K2Y11_17310 [bacterium]|nr:hypothetical protein [bacterium]
MAANQEIDTRVRGRRVNISAPRRVTIDMLEIARQIPTIPVQKKINIRKTVHARQQLVDRPSWVAIFLRAMALTTMQHPTLRRVYVNGWRPHLFESATNVAMVAIEREYAGEPVVFIGRIRNPEERTIARIDAEINHYKNDPMQRVGLFKRTILLGNMPGFLRRFILRRHVECSGKARVYRSGTFGISVYSGLGAESLHPIAPATSLLNYGVIEPNGDVTVRLIYDHRVTDGSMIARAMNTLEETLNTVILDELNQHVSLKKSKAA